MVENRTERILPASRRRPRSTSRRQERRRSDTTAPTLTTTIPADNATGVAVGANLVLTFNEAVQAGSGFIEIRKASNGSPRRDDLGHGPDAGQLLRQSADHQPDDRSAGGTRLLRDDGVGRCARSREQRVCRHFVRDRSTSRPSPPADTTAPTLQSTTPADNATSVLPSVNIVLTFDEAVKAGRDTSRSARSPTTAS